MSKKLKVLMTLIPLVLFIGACDTNQSSISSSISSEEKSLDQTYETTEESTVSSEMTEVEINAFEKKLGIIQSNVDYYESTEQVGDSEVLFATLQEMYEYNLTPEQEEQIQELVSRLPGEFIDYQNGLAMSKSQ